MIIYKIKNKLNGKIYIGQTEKSLEERWKQHASCKEDCYYLVNAIKKYGKDNFECSILSRCNSFEELDHRESYYIKLYKSLAPNGYNLTTGGRKFHEFSDIAKARMSVSQKKKCQTPGYLEKMREVRMLFLKNNPEFGEQHSKRLKQQYKDNPELLNLLAIRKGGKPFKAIRKDTLEIVWEGVNQAECARILGVHQANISNCLKFKNKSSFNGYIFRYIGEEHIIFETISRESKKTQNVETGKIYDSTLAAARSVGKDGSGNIKRAIRTGKKAYGYHWRFA